MKYILAIAVIAMFLLVVGCGPSVPSQVEEWEESADEWEEENWEDKEFEELLEEEEKERLYNYIPGAAFSDAVTKQYSRNNVQYNYDEEYFDFNEQNNGMRVVVEYTIDFFSMEDQDTIVGDAYNDWFLIIIEDLNSWNYKLDSMQYEYELGMVKDELEGKPTNTPFTFGFDYKGLEWKCTGGSAEAEGVFTEAGCDALYNDRLKVHVTSRSADDSEGIGPSLTDSEMTARLKEKIDLINFNELNNLLDTYQDWKFEDYPLH